MLWLDDRRGYLSDWVTQRWVQLTGHRVNLETTTWLQGPIGQPTGIGPGFFEELAAREQLVLRSRGGLLPSVAELAGPGLEPARIDPRVAAFYERTGAFDLDAWSEWCGAFRPFGRLLALIFSRRLQQLNVPLSALDTSLGIRSEVYQLIEPATGEARYTAWVRQLTGSHEVLYAGSYSVTRVPAQRTPCVKVVFPLPNGNAVVIMTPTVRPDGSLTLTSAGQGFGDAGFYFTVHTPTGAVWARYLRSLRERIHVFGTADREVRADHVLALWGATFLRLHYRLRATERRGGTDAC